MNTFEEVLNKYGYLIYTNKGFSMMPLIRQNKDLLIIKSLDRPPKKNDAVLFRRSDGTYILHRIVKCRQDKTYYIAGDNCAYGEIVRKDQILGILTQIKRDGKVISTDVDDPSFKHYLKKVPLQRMKLKIHWAVRLPLRFTKKIRRSITKS